MVQHVLRLDVPDLVAYDEEYLIIVTKVYQTRVENDDGILCSNGTGIDVIAPSDVQFGDLLQVENATCFHKILVYLGIVVLRDLQVTARILNVIHSLDEVGCHPFASRGKERDAFQFLQGGSVQWMLVLTMVETCEYLLVVYHNAVFFEFIIFRQHCRGVGNYPSSIKSSSIFSIKSLGI